MPHHTLLHDDSPDEDASCPDWRMWLRAAGISAVNPSHGLSFDQSSLVLDAALAGQGVALAKARLADGDLRAGRLVQPFGLDRPLCRSQGVRFAYIFFARLTRPAIPMSKPSAPGCGGNAHPGRIAAEIPVDLPTPRDRASHAFVDLKRQVLERMDVHETAPLAARAA